MNNIRKFSKDSEKKGKSENWIASGKENHHSIFDK